MVGSKLVIKEDTFTPWAEKKISTVDAVQEKLLIFLKDLFLGILSEEEIVPHLSGELEESAYDRRLAVGKINLTKEQLERFKKVNF